MTWYRIKLGVSYGTTLDMDALHVLIGTLALLLFAAVMRRSIADRWPWLTILAAELLNEWNDLRVERWPDLGSQLGEGAKDVLLTMALPTLLLFMARYQPNLLLCTRPPDRDKQP